MTQLSLEDIGKNSRKASYDLAFLSSEEKSKALLAFSEALREHASCILSANAIDMERARSRGMAPGLMDRLMLDASRIASMASGMEQVATLDDPIGVVDEEIRRPNGLYIRRVRVPLGVVGVIYEARPNVSADVFSLCFKTGNACILRGGSDAIDSNRAIVSVFRDALSGVHISPDAVQLIEDTDRETARAFMQMRDYVDVLIPRGGAGLIREVVKSAAIPVIETGTGNCHIYVDENADIEMALSILWNAKTQRISVCNTAESLVVHEKIAPSFLPAMEERFDGAVEFRADQTASTYLKKFVPASEEDFGTEYLDYILSVKVVSTLEEAVQHINRYSTGHSESIITDSSEHAAYFLSRVDSAAVYHNASTRFTDGGEFGFGAEIGISTQKLHARGPMGLAALTSYKYQIEGTGQIRS